MGNLFSFIVIDICKDKLDSIEGLFTDSLVIWYSTGSCLSCYYFCKEERGVYKPLFFKTFHSVFLDGTGCSMNTEPTWIIYQLALLGFCNLK